MLERWQRWARQGKSLVYALVVVARDPRTPWYARALAVCVIAYALSPLDLIPDPIPILGYLDDLILIPLGVALVVKLLPATVWHDARLRATAAVRDGAPGTKLAAGVIVILWLGLAVAAVLVVRRFI